MPIFAPIADVILLGAIFHCLTADPVAVGDASIWEQYHAFILYAIFLFFDLLCAGVALRYENLSLKNLWMVIPQRFVYRPLMYSVLFKSFVKAIKGEMQGWGVLKRKGSMCQLPVEIPKTAPVLPKQKPAVAPSLQPVRIKRAEEIAA